MSYTRAVLMVGQFELDWHPKLVDDISFEDADDRGCWADMEVVIQRVHSGSCRSDDWEAPLGRRAGDIGEIKRRAGKRLYRLYVRAFTEEPAKLYLLHFAWKPSGQAGLAVQDDQIDVALGRMIEIGRS